MRKLLLFLLLLVVVVEAHAQAPVAMMSYPGLNTVAAQTGINLSGSPVNIHRLVFRPVGTVTTCTIALDTSVDGVTWSAGGAIAGTGCTANGEATSISPLEANFVRVNLTVFSGSGSVNIVYIGTSSVLGTPVVGSGGVPLSTQASGALNIGGFIAPTAGAANNAAGVLTPGNSTPFPLQIFPSLFNGSTWDPQFYCPNSTTFSVASTTTQVIALSGSTKIRICSFDINPSTITAGSTDIVAGTGTNCGTGTATLTGAYTLPAAAVVDITPSTLSPSSPLTAPAGAAVCVRAVTSTVNGFIVWAQF